MESKNYGYEKLIEKGNKKLDAVSTISLSGMSFGLLSSIYEPSTFCSLGNPVLLGTSLACEIMKYGNMRFLKKVDNIQKSTLYQECRCLYIDFVKDIASFFKQSGFDDGLSAYALYIYCLTKGYFSLDLSYKYETNGFGFDFFSEIFGSTVTTGRGCCRHNASLFTDVVNEMGGLAANFCVSKSRFRLKPNHMVTGIIHDDKKLIVEPTILNPRVHFVDRAYFFDDDKLKNNKVVAHSFENRKRVYKLDSYADYFINDLRVNALLNYPSFQEDDIFELYYDSYLKYEGLCNKRKDDILCFAHDLQPKVKVLAKTNRLVIPKTIL